MKFFSLFWFEENSNQVKKIVVVIDKTFANMICNVFFIFRLFDWQNVTEQVKKCK